MRRRRAVEPCVAATLTKYQPAYSERPGFGITSRFGDRLLTSYSRCRRIERLRGQSRNVMTPRSCFSLALLGAIIFTLLPAKPAHAEQNQYGSIAYSESTMTATVGFAGSIGDAALAAANQCQTQSGAQDCAAHLWFHQGYGALARGSNGSFSTGWGTDAQWADTYAIQTCQDEFGGENCQVVFRAQSPRVTGESLSATGGVFETPISPQPPPTYSPPPTYEPPTLPTPAAVSMPNLAGLSLDNARRALPSSLQLGTVSGNDGTVVDQQPRAGDLVAPDTRVNLVLGASGFPTWLAVLALLAVLGAGLALLTARALRHNTEHQRWEARIRVESAPDVNPTIRLWEPDSGPRFTVWVELRPDRGTQSVREVVSR